MKVAMAEFGDYGIAVALFIAVTLVVGILTANLFSRAARGL